MRGAGSFRAALESAARRVSTEAIGRAQPDAAAQRSAGGVARMFNGPWMLGSTAGARLGYRIAEARGEPFPAAPSRLHFCLAVPTRTGGSMASIQRSPRDRAPCSVRGEVQP